MDRERFTRTLAGAIFLLMFWSCGGPKPGDEDWNDPSKCLCITFRSVPSSANVYGVVEGKPGAYLGKTPLTLKFWKAHRTWEPIFWKCANQAAPMTQVIAHSFRAASVQLLDIPSYPSDKRWRNRVRGEYLNSESAEIHCFVTKDGYESQLLTDTYKHETVSTDIPNVFRGHKVYNVVLEPIE